jgi:hypothetical protein
MRKRHPQRSRRFVQAAFPGKVHELQRLIAEKLAHECELALLYLLLSLKAVINDSSTGWHLRSVHIVVFQKDNLSPPSVSRESAGRILCVAKASG